MSFPSEPSQKVDLEAHAWGNYFICGLKGVYDYLEEKALPTPAPVGLQVQTRAHPPQLSSPALLQPTAPLVEHAVGAQRTARADPHVSTCKPTLH